MQTPHIRTSLTNLELSLCTQSGYGPGYGSYYSSAAWDFLEPSYPNLRSYTCRDGFDLGVSDPADYSPEEGEDSLLIEKVLAWKAAGRLDLLKALPKTSLDTLRLMWASEDDMQCFWPLLVTHPQLNAQLTSIELRNRFEALPLGTESVLRGTGPGDVLPSLRHLVIEVSDYRDLLKLQPLTQLKSLVIRVVSDEQDIAVGNSSIAFCSCFVNLEHLEYTTGSYGSHYLDNQALEELSVTLLQLKTFCFAGHMASHELTRFPGEGSDWAQKGVVGYVKWSLRVSFWLWRSL
jgi:hypothetical protein